MNLSPFEKVRPMPFLTATLFMDDLMLFGDLFKDLCGIWDLFRNLGGNLGFMRFRLIYVYNKGLTIIHSLIKDIREISSFYFCTD